jgi:putative glutamine amidotransferase
MALGMTYVRAIEAAGGLPVVVPPVPARDARRLLGRLDGLVLSGGPDLAPGAYGAQPHVELGPTEPHLDRFEYAMAREAVRLHLPTFGICRGAQTLNVVCGGTLHQHLPDVVGDTIVHRQSTDGRIPTHPVTIAPGTRWPLSSEQRS